MKKKLVTIIFIFLVMIACSYCNVNANNTNQLVEDGIYEIETGVDSNKVIDVLDASKISGGNVQIFTRNINAECQKVKVKYLENGYYTLTFVHSNMLLDVSNGNTEDHTNVWQCRENGADAQKWMIKDTGNGYYNIISKLSNTYLTTANEENANCTNIEINSLVNGNSQKFKFNKIEKITGTKTIEDGTYEIETGADSNKVIDVIDASKISGGNVQIFTRNINAECQKVEVKYLENGYYTLTFVHSNMLLDVSNGNTEEHTNVWQCRENGADAQKWIIKDAGNGYYNIISKLSSTYLTVAGDETSNCTNVEISSANGKNSQKFKFNKIEKIAGTKTIEDGTYEIETGVDSNKVLDVIDASIMSGGNVQIFTRNTYADCQKVNVKYLGDGYYTLSFVHSNMLLDVANGKKADHTNVWQCRENASDAQKWIIKEVGNGYYNIISKLSNKYLTVAKGEITNNTNVEVSFVNEGNSQKFKFNKIEQEKEIEEGLYEIETGVDSNKTLDVIDAKKDSGANVQIYTKNDANCQKVIVKKEQDGYYTLTFLHSEMLLDVANGNTQDHTNVWQCRANNSDAQKWKIKDVGNEYYNIISKLSKTYLTVADGKVANCTNIEICSANGNSSQKFKFNKLNEVYGTRTIQEGLYEIETGVDSNKALDVIDARKDSGANVQIYTKNNANCQKVNLTYLGEGYYTIKFLHSKMLLDVANGNTINHTNVWQCRENGADAQKWIIKDIGNGYYSIISKLSGKYLTVAGGKTNNCTNVEITSADGSNSQKFRFNSTKRNSNIDIDSNRYPGYKERIEILAKAHPNWNFELLYTGLKFDSITAGECAVHSRNLVPINYSGEWICSVCGTKLYDSGWYCASEKAIAYYMDPRNFLDETNVFQFQNLNSYMDGVCTLQGLQNKVNGTFLQYYAKDIDRACRNTNVNSYYITARLLQEQGNSGTSIGTGMNGGDGKTYYNPFNIGACGNSWTTIYNNALSTAKYYGWDSMEKAIEGGITFCKKNWLENYQNTLYQNKFDIDTRNGTSLYEHQYMQNLMAAYSEARTLRGIYANTNRMDSEFTFIIPIYENMSLTLSQLPSNNSEILPINVQVNANGGLNLRKEANTDSSVIKTIDNGTVLLSVQRGINSNWQKVILTDGTIGYMSGSYLKTIKDITNCNYTAKIKTNDGTGCYVRIGPSTGLDKLTALPEGTIVTVIEKGTYNNINGFDWCRIILSDGRHAYMPLKYLN